MSPDLTAAIQAGTAAAYAELGKTDGYLERSVAAKIAATAMA